MLGLQFDTIGESGVTAAGWDPKNVAVEAYSLAPPQFAFGSRHLYHGAATHRATRRFGAVALITISIIGDELRAHGELSLAREADYCRSANQDAQATLVAGWEWRSNALKIFADRLGLVPIFYSVQRSEIHLSDSLARIAVALPSAQWDLDALAVFLRLGFFVGDDTPFQGVKVLPPGTRAMITAACFEVPRYVGPSVRNEWTNNRSLACSRYEELFRDAVSSRCLDGRIGLPLSGGRDSRHILLELARSARRPDVAVTYSPDPIRQQESVVAARLCAALDVPHVTVVDDGRFVIEKELQKHHKTHYLTDEHTWYLQVAASLKAQGADIIFDGIGGDVLSNGLFYDERLLEAFVSNDVGRTVDLLLDERRQMPHLSATWQRRLSWERARERLSQEVALHAGQPNPIASFYFWNRTCREIALAPLCLGADFRVAMPYVSPDLLEFLLGLPARGYGAPGFHDEVIRRAFPEYAQIPYQSVKQITRSPRARATLGDSLSYLACCWTALRASLVRPRFVAIRAARILALQDVSRDEWWLQQIVYLLGLRDAQAGQARGLVVAGAKAVLGA